MPTGSVPDSPYGLALGGRFAELHPRLSGYFGPIPSGWVGEGSGVFTTVGTPRRWLWPLLAVLERQGVLFPVWETDVPFTVLNRPVQNGEVAVAAVRTFHTRKRDRQMVDAVTAHGAVLVDYLGRHRRYRTQLAASVEGGALVMSSTGMAIRIRNSWLAVPRWVAPVVSLTERFDDQSGRQHVAVVVTIPGLGRVYEYAGFFDYGLRPVDGPVQRTNGGS